MFPYIMCKYSPDFLANLYIYTYLLAAGVLNKKSFAFTRMWLPAAPPPPRVCVGGAYLLSSPNKLFFLHHKYSVLLNTRDVSSLNRIYIYIYIYIYRSFRIRWKANFAEHYNCSVFISHLRPLDTAFCQTE